MHANRHLVSDFFIKKTNTNFVAHDTRGKKFFAFTPFTALLNGSLAITMIHLQ